jgi:hypothetical protein
VVLKIVRKPAMNIHCKKGEQRKARTEILCGFRKINRYYVFFKEASKNFLLIYLLN